MLQSVQPLQAQDFTFGRSPQGQVPSGSASEFIDINAQGLGINARLGHVAGNDVGRTESLSLIHLSPYVNIGDGLFFGDGRFNYANNGEIAYSLGAGYRHYITAWDAVLGGYGYYDWDEITGADFRQWSYGFELLAHRWEARGNVYRPYGDTSQLTASRVDTGSAAFVDSRLEFNQIDSFAEALRGFDAEVGFLLPGEFSERIDLRAFGGGYGYEGDGNGYFSGFSTRLQADIRDTVELGIKVTHDQVLNTNFSFSAIVHMGGYHSQAHTSRSAMQRMAEPVRRNLNIAAAQNSVTRGGVIATAADGSTLDIVHVNSNATGAGTGTVLDPFQSLTTGLTTPGADIVFTHAGSTYDALGVNLAAGQTLLGEGFDPNRSAAIVNTIQIPGVGLLELPASPTFASNSTFLRPTLTNSPDPAVRLANDSRFGGFVIEGATGVGVLADAVSGFQINDVQVTNAVGDGVFLNDVTGTGNLTNVFIQNAAGAGLHVMGGDGQITFGSTSTTNDPSFARIDNNTGEALLIENTLAGATLDMSGSTIDDVSDGTSAGLGVVINAAAGNATIDNVNVDHSLGGAPASSGIRITGGSTGTFTFRNTIRDATMINSVGLASIVVEDLAGTTLFQDLSILNPTAESIDIDRLTGRFTVQDTTTIGAAAAGNTSSFISVQDSQGVTIFGDITINALGSGGRGIELINNVGLNSFNASGVTTINSVGAAAIAIDNDPSAVLFSTVSVNDPGLQGLFINNTTGIIQFQQPATFTQNANAASPVVDIQSAQNSVFFNILNTTATTGVTGVQLLNNSGATSGISIVELNVNTTDGTGLFANTNRLIQTFGGDFVATDAAAIDVSDSGINMTLDTIVSTNSPTFGIHLENTNMDQGKQFIVRPGGIADPQFGDGGTISGATNEGVLLENAGQIELVAMTLDDNEYGIRVNNTGLLFDASDELIDDQFLLLSDMQVIDSDVRGLETRNLTLLRMVDSNFIGNGDLGPVGRESVLLQYDEFISSTIHTSRTTVGEYAEDNRFAVEILRTSFIDDTDDVISINNFGADEAPIVIDISNNDFILNDANDFDPFDQLESGIEVFWDGPAGINVGNNQFSLAGPNEPQTAIDINALSLDDLLQLEVNNNSIVNTTNTGAFGLDVVTRGDSVSTITNNNFVFDGVDSNGMRFNLADNATVNLINNTLQFNDTGGFGMNFTRVNGPSFFQISGNLIQLSDAVILGAADDAEEGIRFQGISGTINLFGAQNNIIELISANGDIDFFFTPATPSASINGGILVNGVFGP